MTADDETRSPDDTGVGGSSHAAGERPVSTPHATARAVLAHAPSGARVELLGALEQAGVAVVGEVETGDELVAKVEELLPDVVLADVAVLGADPSATVRALADRLPAVRVLVVVDGAGDDHVALAREGAAGALRTGTPAAEVADAVRRAARGEAVLPPGWASTVLTELDGLVDDPSSMRATTPAITPTEREVLMRLGGGAAPAEVAAMHDVPVRVVTVHAASALAKLARAHREHRTLSSR